MHRLVIIDGWQELEIAELTGKDHYNVMKDIRRILDEAEIDPVQFNGVYLGGNGQDRVCFNLPRLECDLVVSGYSAKYRMATFSRSNLKRLWSIALAMVKPVRPPVITM